MGLIQTTPPAAEPLTLAEAKAHLRVDDDVNEDDAMIASLIVAAREYAEVYTGRALITQEWQYVMDEFPRRHLYGERIPHEFRLPKPKLQSVQSITYTANDGTPTTLDPAMYVVDTASIVGRIALAHGQWWPDALRQANAVTVAFTCGYGDAAAVPAGIKQAMLLCIGSWYENRESVIVSVGRALVSEVPFTVDALLSAHRVVEF